MVGMLAMSAAALGCAGANPTGQPSATISQAPTPTTQPTTQPTPLPTATPGARGTPLAGCLGPQPALGAIVAVDPGQRAACFGRADMTFLAVRVAAEIDCAPIKVEPAWLWCPPAALLAPAGGAGPGPRSRPAAWAAPAAAMDRMLVAALDVPMLEVHVPSGWGLDPERFAPGAVVRVTGHFDDPAAAACHLVSAQPGWPVPGPEEVVHTCRGAFVVTSMLLESA